MPSPEKDFLWQVDSRNLGSGSAAGRSQFGILGFDMPVSIILETQWQVVAKNSW